MKKYEAVLEAAFQLVEKGCRPEDLDNLKRAVEPLAEFRKLGEPVFILRGQDRAAARTVYAWGIFASGDATQSLAEHASREHDRFLDWQHVHFRLVKMPD